MGWVGSWYGLVWFGQNSEAEFKTMNQSINHKGGYRAARAAKNHFYCRYLVKMLILIWIMAVETLKGIVSILQTKKDICSKNECYMHTCKLVRNLKTQS